jgi:hypothetical protein
MAYITIKTNPDEDSLTLQERLLPSDLESEFFCAHLVERLRWAVEDADRARSGVASVEDRGSPSHAGVG